MEGGSSNKYLNGSQTMSLATPYLPVVKKRFPFRLGTTSYIVPAAIIPHLRLLGPYIDELELVFFESGLESNLPSVADIRVMRQLALAFDLTYSVHLPGDIFLGDPDAALRRKFQETVLRFYERTLPLEPEVFILHLDRRNAQDKTTLCGEAWIGRVADSVEKLIRKGMEPHQMAVENLDYPLEFIAFLAESLGMGLCLDIGHLLRYGYSVAAQMDRFLGRSLAVHLHGVKDGVDHLGVQWISPEEWTVICHALQSYKYSVSLEVFSLDDLIPSIHRLQASLFEHIAWKA